MRTMTIGTGPRADVSIEDQYASPLHAQVSRDDQGRVWVEDLGSTNGTFINERRVWDAAELRPGDTLRVGRTRIPWDAA